MSKITVILGHPNSKSFNSAIAETYRDTALKAGHDVKYFALGDMEFDPILHEGYNKRQNLEPDLQTAIDAVLWADHLVFVFPTWWGTMPAILKGFFDRAFLPGLTFKYHENDPMWDKLLAGKSAHCLITMDTPRWFFSLIYGDPAHKQIKRTILEFCGVKPVKITNFSEVRYADAKKRVAWLEKVKEIASKTRL